MKKIFVFLMIMGFFTFSVFAGVEWFTTIKTTGKGKKANNEIFAHTHAQGGNVKQVFEGVSNENMFYFQDGYWLYKADDNNIYVVNDKKYSYTVISIDGLLQMTGMLGQLVKIKIVDHSIDTEVLPGETLLGYPCNHLKITTTYTMKIKIAFIKKTMRMHEVKEIWGTPKIAGLDEINQAFLRKDFKIGIPDLDELIQEQMEKQKKIGFPLKVITHSVQKNKKGKVKSESTTTMTVTKINAKNFPKSFFEIPGNYDRQEGPWEKKKLGVF